MFLWTRRVAAIARHAGEASPDTQQIVQLYGRAVNRLLAGVAAANRVGFARGFDVILHFHMNTSPRILRTGDTGREGRSHAVRHE